MLHFIFKIVLVLMFSSILNAKSLEKVTLQLQWKHQFEFAGFYMAKEKGYYKDAGIDVEFLEFTKSTNLVDTVVSDKADYALGYSSIIADYLNDAPIVFVANFFKQSPLVLITQKNITSLSQLKGSKIEGFSNSIDHITLYTMLEKFGISISDVQTIDSTFSIEAFVNKEVDAMSVFTTNELFLLDKSGVKYNIFDPVSYGAKYYDVNLFTSKKELLNHPKRVEAFRKASIKGWEYALKHQEESVDMILQKYNSQKKSKEALLFEAKQIEHIVLPNVYSIGSIDTSRVQMIADTMKQFGFVQSTQKNDLKKFIYKYKENSNTISLEEREYLKEKQFITACVNPAWMPFSAVVDGKYVGINADYMDIFEKKLGIPINIYNTQSMSQSLGFAKAKKCDFLSMAVQTQKRSEYLNFTQPYFHFTNVLVTKINKRMSTDLKYLKKEKIAVIQDCAEAELIKSKYPNLEIIEVQNIQEGLEKVENQEVYGLVENAVVIDYYFKKEDYLKFKIGHYYSEKSDLRLGVRNDDIILYGIFEKILQDIPLQEQRFIRSKWFSTRYSESSDYDFLYQILIAVFIILGILGYRHYSIQSLNRELKKRVQEELDKSKDKDKMIFHQSKLVAMGEMIQNIAHQWRQPLSQVNSCVLVIDDILDEKNIVHEVIEEKLEEIESLTKYMSNTIEDFRNFFDKDKEKEFFYIEDTLDKSLSILSGRIDKYKIKIVRGLATQHNCYGYPSELQQVFIVIINNAIDMIIEKEVLQGKITIDIRLKEGMISIVISDNAGGISQEFLDKIFEPYYTTKHKSQGTGLGLYICKIIIEDSLGGELNVKNNFNGATFIIKLKNQDQISKRGI